MADLARRCAALICAAGLTGASGAARAQPPSAPTSGKMNAPLAVGLGILGLSYVPSAIVGFAVGGKDARALPLVVPVVGPLIAMETLSVQPDARWIFGVASAVQAVGMAVTAIGVALPDDPSMSEKIGSLRITPAMAWGGAGLVLSGQWSFGGAQSCAVGRDERIAVAPRHERADLAEHEP